MKIKPLRVIGKASNKNALAKCCEQVYNLIVRNYLLKRNDNYGFN